MLHQDICSCFATVSNCSPALPDLGLTSALSHHTTLHYTVLYCTTHCTTHYTILYCNTHCTTIYTILYSFFTLHYTLYYTIRYYTILYCNTRCTTHNTILYYTALPHYTTPYYTILHVIPFTVHYTIEPLHCPRLHTSPFTPSYSRYQASHVTFHN